MPKQLKKPHEAPLPLFLPILHCLYHLFERIQEQHLASQLRRSDDILLVDNHAKASSKATLPR